MFICWNPASELGCLNTRNQCLRPANFTGRYHYLHIGFFFLPCGVSRTSVLWWRWHQTSALWLYFLCVWNLHYYVEAESLYFTKSAETVRNMYANKAHSPQHSFVTLFVSVCAYVFVLLSARFTYEILLVGKKFKSLAIKLFHCLPKCSEPVISPLDWLPVQMGIALKNCTSYLKSTNQWDQWAYCCAYSYMKVLLSANRWLLVVLVFQLERATHLLSLPLNVNWSFSCLTGYCNTLFKWNNIFK